jgi:hypothetical protein
VNRPRVPVNDKHSDIFVIHAEIGYWALNMIDIVGWHDFVN